MKRQKILTTAIFGTAKAFLENPYILHTWKNAQTIEILFLMYIGMIKPVKNLGSSIISELKSGNTSMPRHYRLHASLNKIQSK